jgi:glc operon protein GlcG
MQATPIPSPTSPPLEYGAPISLDLARRVMAAAEAEALANHWPMVIAIVDSSAHLVMLHKFDHAQHASVSIAQGKAETAVNFKRATKVFEDAVAGGGMGVKFLSIDGLSALEGGVPLLYKGKIVGAIGVSGMLSAQDGQVAAAGAKSLLDAE